VDFLIKGEFVSQPKADFRLGAIYAIVTAVLLATQSPFSALTAKHLSTAKFIGVTEAVLLLCVPFMLTTRDRRADFRALLSSRGNVAKLFLLLLIGLLSLLCYVAGLNRGNPVVIAAMLNLDPFWAALIAYLVTKKSIPNSLPVFAGCLSVAFAGTVLIAISQSDGGALSLSNLRVDTLSGALLALPVPIFTALSGTFVGKWFSDYDESATIAVTFTMAAAVVIPAALVVAYAQSDLRIRADALPALALLAVGTVLAVGIGRVVYQRSLTITNNNNGYVSMFFLLIPGITCLLSLAMSPWIHELKFTASPVFFIGLALVALPIFVFSWRSWHTLEKS
jgi:hypothetical protein